MTVQRILLIDTNLDQGLCQLAESRGLAPEQLIETALKQVLIKAGYYDLTTEAAPNSSKTSRVQLAAIPDPVSVVTIVDEPDPVEPEKVRKTRVKKPVDPTAKPKRRGRPRLINQA